MGGGPMGGGAPGGCMGGGGGPAIPAAPGGGMAPPMGGGMAPPMGGGMTPPMAPPMGGGLGRIAAAPAPMSPNVSPVDPADAMAAAMLAMTGELDLDVLFPDMPVQAVPAMPAIRGGARQYYFLPANPNIGRYYFLQAPMAEPDLPMPDVGPGAGLGG
ncbi:MAG: hypothetical protein H0T89_24990 [Deltaproteobacteria bacterium]|nr:hypothetical protein [Deltaproteobacteria bacterium]